jgi:hypothetical protein
MPGIAPGAVAGDCIQRVLEGRAQTTRRSLQEVTAEALGNQSLKRFVDPDDIAALSVFRQPNRFQGKPSRSTATLKPRSNTSPAPHDLRPPAGDVATAVFVRLARPSAMSSPPPASPNPAASALCRPGWKPICSNAAPVPSSPCPPKPSEEFLDPVRHEDPAHPDAQREKPGVLLPRPAHGSPCICVGTP